MYTPKEQKLEYINLHTRFSVCKDPLTRIRIYCDILKHHFSQEKENIDPELTEVLRENIITFAREGYWLDDAYEKYFERDLDTDMDFSMSIGIKFRFDIEGNVKYSVKQC